MAAGQQHRAASVARGAPPFEARPRFAQPVPIVDLGIEQVAHRPGRQQALEFFKQRIPSKYKTDHALHAGAGHGVAQRAILLHAQAHRLLYQQMLPRLGGGDPLFGMHVIRTAQIDDVHSVVGQHPVEVVADVTIQAELVGQPPGTLDPPAGHRHDLGMRVLQPTRRVSKGYLAHAVDGNAQFLVCHNDSLSRGSTPGVFILLPPPVTRAPDHPVCSEKTTAHPPVATIGCSIVFTLSL